jgi:hypothetical protein
MAKGGVDGFETAVPLVPQWFTGYRSWDVKHDQDGWHLTSVTFPYTWRDGINEAVCQARPKAQAGCKDALHPDVYTHLPECYVPDTCAGVTLDCGCGFWHYDSPNNWYKGGGGGFKWFTGSMPVAPGRPWVSGIVHGFGRMVVGTQGFRAGKAVIAALIMPPHISPATLPIDVQLGMTIEDLTDIRAREGAVLAEQIEDSLRSAYPTVPFFRTVEAALAAVPLTPMADFMQTLKRGEPDVA